MASFIVNFPTTWSSSTPSAFSPLEFRAQHFEECFLETYQLCRMLGLRGPHNVAVAHRHADLPVETQIGFFLPGLDLDFNFDAVAYHHWTMGQSVRRDGRND